MEVFFSNQEILWKESAFPLAYILFIIALVVFSFAAYLFYTYKFRVSCFGSIISVLIVSYILWNGTGCNSDLRLKINTFAKNATVADNLSKSEYTLIQEDFVGYLKQEYRKSEKNKTVTYHQLLLLLKNGSYFKLKESNNFEEIKILIPKIQKEFDLPIYFNRKEIPKDLKVKPEFDSREVCDFRFENIKTERSETTCTLSWKAKMPNYIYPIICIFFMGLLIWIDSIFLEGFTKSHFFWLIGISLFVIPFSYLGLLRWNTTTVVIFDKEKITTYLDSSFFGKRGEASILYSEIKSFDAQIETASDSITITSTHPDVSLILENIKDVAFHSKYLSISVYGLPVVDKLRLCDQIGKLRGF
jgi:hypothetical protein